jgi:hypothetical protein
MRSGGFAEESGRGSHVGWRRPLLPDEVTLAGADGDDAKSDQEKQARIVLAKLRDASERR